ncbi:MAG: hypothetical protein ACRC4W_02720 [Treponemataceae bacterium]
MQTEDYPLQSEKLLSRWEEVLLGQSNEALDNQTRLDLLQAQKAGSITAGSVTKESLIKLGETYGERYCYLVSERYCYLVSVRCCT